MESLQNEVEMNKYLEITLTISMVSMHQKESRPREFIHYSFYSVQSEFDSVQSAEVAQRIKHLFTSDLNFPWYFP